MRRFPLWFLFALVPFVFLNCAPGTDFQAEAPVTEEVGEPLFVEPEPAPAATPVVAEPVPAPTPAGRRWLAVGTSSHTCISTQDYQWFGIRYTPVLGTSCNVDNIAAGLVYDVRNCGPASATGPCQHLGVRHYCTSLPSYICTGD